MHIALRRRRPDPTGVPGQHDGAGGGPRPGGHRGRRPDCRSAADNDGRVPHGRRDPGPGRVPAGLLRRDDAGHVGPDAGADRATARHAGAARPAPAHPAPGHGAECDPAGLGSVPGRRRREGGGGEGGRATAGRRGRPRSPPSPTPRSRLWSARPVASTGRRQSTRPRRASGRSRSDACSIARAPSSCSRPRSPTRPCRRRRRGAARRCQRAPPSSSGSCRSGACSGAMTPSSPRAHLAATRRPSCLRRHRPSRRSIAGVDDRGPEARRRAGGAPHATGRRSRPWPPALRPPPPPVPTPAPVPRSQAVRRLRSRGGAGARAARPGSTRFAAVAVRRPCQSRPSRKRRGARVCQRGAVGGARVRSVGRAPATPSRASTERRTGDPRATPHDRGHRAAPRRRAVRLLRAMVGTGAGSWPRR